jgi:16S rRNA A1518/A1519 N6-dimethyltransferase RsmA/KsgA/DIM1 with predicted DNA glycosylase/AP lyase activity
MNNTTDAKQIWEHFRALPGSNHIATLHSIEGLISWIKRQTPRSVLEVGAGIGTLTFTTVSAMSEVHGSEGFHITSTEDNEFCISALETNLRDQWGKFELIHLNSKFATKQLFDFVIIDGGDQNPGIRLEGGRTWNDIY